MVGHRPTIALPDKQRSSKQHTSVHIINRILAHTRSVTLCTRERRRGVWRLRREGLPQGAERGEGSCCHVKTTMSEQTIESGQSSPRQRYMLLLYSDLRVRELSWYRLHYYWPQLPLLLLLRCYPPSARARQTTPLHIIRLWVDPFNSIEILWRSFTWTSVSWLVYCNVQHSLGECWALSPSLWSNAGSYLFIVSESWTDSYLHYNTQTMDDYLPAFLDSDGDELVLFTSLF